MRLNTGYTKWGYKSGVALLAVLALINPSAMAFPFFHKKKPQVESIPPATNVKPSLLHPGGASPNGTTNTGTENDQTPPPQQASTPAPAPDPLQVMIEQGIFPADAASRTTPITRAELASVLVKALKHNTDMVSEFPFYRDVPKDYWAYVPIEVAREKRLIVHQESHGNYQPEKLVTYAEVYRALSRALTGPPPSEAATEHLLSQFKDGDKIPDWLKTSVAKLAQVRFFGNPETQDIYLHPNEQVTPAGLAPLAVYLMHVTEHEAALMRETAKRTVLPAGLQLTLTPASAIYESQLSVGNTVYFTLVYPVDPLPKGTILRGTVREVMEEHTYVVELTQARTPLDAYFQTRADLTIIFPPKKKMSFIVPGEAFTATTAIPPNVPASAIPVQPQAVPAGSSAKTAVPPLTPPIKPNPPAVARPTGSP